MSKLRVYKICTACKRPMMRIDEKTGQLYPSVSTYPYCLGCFNKHAYDSEFGTWVKKKLGQSLIKK